MNIYSQKQTWKILLIGVGLFIVGATLWFTNNLVKRMAANERKQIELWAQAIQRKANLVKYTNDLFEKLKTEERKRISIWAEATRMSVISESQTDLPFYLKIIQENNTIPVILTDESGNINGWMNIDHVPQISMKKLSDVQRKILQARFVDLQRQQQPLEIMYYKDMKSYLYYGETKLFSELRNVLNDLIQSFISDVVSNSASVPVIYTNPQRSAVIASSGIDSTLIASPEGLEQILADFEKENTPLVVEIGNGSKNMIFYKDSETLNRLKYYPWVMIIIISVFIVIAYFLFSTARNAEQNQVWVGMSKETAHQIGTPLSSLVAWVELLKMRGHEKETVEIEKDIKRLETIAERFSKIGSQPALSRENVYERVQHAIDYMRARTSEKVHFEMPDKQAVFAQINAPLFDWVLENLVRNAVDSMEARGTISIQIIDLHQFVYVDVTDTGKGIPKSLFSTIFKPGFTTKKRGWGLGLSLSKRIIENYHNGKIFVKQSEAGKGTTFRIVLTK